jgi:hypothetical protein
MSKKVLTKLPTIKCGWCAKSQPLSASDYYADKFICDFCGKPNDVGVMLFGMKPPTKLSKERTK